MGSRTSQTTSWSEYATNMMARTFYSVPLSDLGWRIHINNRAQRNPPILFENSILFNSVRFQSCAARSSRGVLSSTGVFVDLSDQVIDCWVLLMSKSQPIIRKLCEFYYAHNDDTTSTYNTNTLYKRSPNAPIPLTPRHISFVWSRGHVTKEVLYARRAPFM
jgi:hypothetical protein